jgi:hypothetical protein
MSFLLGHATPGEAFLATETRIVDMATDAHQDLGGKLMVLRGGGWGAASGILAWTRLAWDAIWAHDSRDIGALSIALHLLHKSAAYEELAAALEDQVPGWQSRRAGVLAEPIPSNAKRAVSTLGQLVVLHRTASGYGGATFDDRGGFMEIRPGRPFCAPPPGITLDEVSGAISRWGGPPVGWQAISRRAAETFAWAAARSDLMSAEIELVHMTPDGDRYCRRSVAAMLADRRE